jgi:hypothetical protein
MKAAHAFLSLGLLISGVLLSTAGAARNPYVTFPPEAERLPAVRYGKLASGECLAELDSRKIPYRGGRRVSTIEPR